MIKTLFAFDKLTDDYHHQELWDPDTESPLFCVSDLCECPEDAIIGRALHDTDDAVNLIIAGFNFCKNGYDAINVEWRDCPEEDDLDEFAEETIKQWKSAQKK